MAKLSDSELLATIDREERNAYGYMSGDLATERANAMDYYLGKPFGNEVEGRSQVVSTDVADTVEWVMPSLLKIFCAGDKVVEFRPRGAEDVEAAEQESEYVNFLVMDKNPGLETFYTWFKDALLQKVGYVKAWFEEVEDTDEEYYEGLGDDELAMILQDADVTPIEHESVEVMTDMGPMMSHNVRVKKVTKDRKLCIAPVPAEEMRIATSHRSISLQECHFVQHYCRKTISDLRAMGYDIDDDFAGDEEEVEMSQEALARDLYGEEAMDDDGGDREMRRVWLKDTYIRIDMDGDGIAELRHVVHAGNTVLENEACDLIPFASITPILMPHRHVGRSYADIVMDLQLIRSTLLRQLLDNMYLANNGRYAVGDRVNLDDMLVSRPGGVVRTNGDPAGAIMPLQHPVLGAPAFSMLEYFDGLRENRTGVTKYNQGLDANTLNKTASGISQIMNASQQRIELVARLFAETGVKDLFLIVHALCRKHSQREDVMRLRGKWVPIDPRQWKKRSDLAISVGLGTGSKDQMLQHIMTILQVQREAIQIGIATPKNIYNTVAKLTQNAGFKDVDEFWTNPEEAPPQEPQPDPEVVKAQMQAQNDEQQRQADVAMKQMDVDVQKYKADLDARVKLQIAEMDRAAKAEIELFKARIGAQVQMHQSEQRAEAAEDRMESQYGGMNE